MLYQIGFFCFASFWRKSNNQVIIVQLTSLLDEVCLHSKSEEQTIEKGRACLDQSLKRKQSAITTARETIFQRHRPGLLAPQLPAASSALFTKHLLCRAHSSRTRTKMGVEERLDENSWHVSMFSTHGISFRRQYNTYMYHSVVSTFTFGFK